MPVTINGNGAISGFNQIDPPTFVVDETNNRVGIGTSTPTQPLDVLGVAQSRSTTSSSRVVLNGGTADGANIQLNRNGSNSQNAYFAQYQGSLFIKNLDSADIVFTNTILDKERMRIDSNGNVQINGEQIDALRYFDIYNVNSGNSAGSIIRFITNNSTNTGVTTVDLVKYRTGGFTIANNDSNGVITLNTALSERMRIDASGNIGVGTTDPLNRRLHVRDIDNQENTTIYSTNASYTSEVFQVIAERAGNSAYVLAALYSGGGVDYEFRFRGDGNAFADGTWAANGADYAEYFEWEDGNPDNEDRRGISVALEGELIRPAVEGDEIIGVISGNPSVVGDASWNKWHEKYLRDEYGSYIFEDYEVLQWTDEEGNERAVDADGPNASDAPEDAEVVIQQRRKLNPNYNPDQEYVNRENRPEWDCVGLMGKLRVRKGQPVDSRWIKMRDISETVEEWLVR
jgi:hypothetical protein